MNLESLRAFCKTLPHVTEDVKWGDDLCMLIGGRMFCVMPMEAAAHGLVVSFKCTPELFAELVERDGIIPAPYMARNQWVALERFNALRDGEIKEYVAGSYGLVKAKLTKKQLEELGSPKKKTTKPSSKKKKK